MKLRLFRIQQVIEITGLSRSTIYKWVSEQRFPAPMKIGDRAVRWRSDELQRWMDDPEGYVVESMIDEVA